MADFYPSTTATGLATLGGTDLLDWVGVGNDGFVWTLYDQSGTGNHLIYNFGNLPKCVSAGAYLGKVTFDDGTLGNASLFMTSPFSNFIAADISALPAALITYGQSFTPATDRDYDFGMIGSNYDAFISNGTSFNRVRQAGPGVGSYVLHSKMDGSSLKNAYNLQPYTSTAQTVTPGTNHSINFGGQNPNYILPGSVSIYIEYPSDQESNRTAITNRINTKYSLF
jgi:hypothetical protein